MLGDIFYRAGTLAGTALGTLEHRLGPDPSDAGDFDPDGTDPDRGSSPDDGASGADGNGSHDGDLLVNAIMGSAAAWLVRRLLKPRDVSWPRVVVAGLGATFLADTVGRTLGHAGQRESPRTDDPDALLVRYGAGVAMAAGYAALLYPRLPGSSMTRGLIFGVMEIAAAPHGGLVRVATDTPGLKFPLEDLAVPIDEDAGPLESLAFGLGLGLLYHHGADGDEIELDRDED